jgi:hypothetical protein
VLTKLRQKWLKEEANTTFFRSKTWLTLFGTKRIFWKEFIIVWTYERGDNSDFSNYRDTSFLLTWYKIVSNIVHSRLCQYVDEITRDHHSCNRPWRPTGLSDVEAPTISGQSAHRRRWGCQPYAPAALHPQEDYWYSFLLRGWVDPRATVWLEGLDKLQNQWPQLGSNSCPSGLENYYRSSAWIHTI